MAPAGPAGGPDGWYQVQNLPQNKLPDLAAARQLVRDGEFDLLEMAFGSPPFVLSQLIRTAFIPSEGCRFIVCDYSAIEARDTGVVGK